VLIVVIFLAVLIMIVFSILRDRSRRRHEAHDF
jgi:heme/copper-type cytochrome/quinol oxidase subunit 2